jgi:hypothetical protein
MSAADMNPTDLAAAANVSRMTIYRALNGRIVHSSVVAQLADALGVEPGDLFTKTRDGDM